MLRKCKKCDAVGEKTIDTQKNEYVYDGTSYYHKDCYIIKLTTRTKGKMSKEDAILEAQRLIALMKRSQDEEESKFKFYELLDEIYDEKPNNFFFQKIVKIINGTYKKDFPRKISFAELIDMYSNKKMIAKLNKISFNKGIEQTRKMDYELGCMFNEYPKYVNAKRRAEKDSEESKQALENINKYKISPDKRFKDVREKVKDENKRSIKIDDLVDDILG